MFLKKKRFLNFFIVISSLNPVKPQCHWIPLNHIKSHSGKGIHGFLDISSFTIEESSVLHDQLLTPTFPATGPLMTWWPDDSFLSAFEKSQVSQRLRNQPPSIPSISIYIHLYPSISIYHTIPFSPSVNWGNWLLRLFLDVFFGFFHLDLQLLESDSLSVHRHLGQPMAIPTPPAMIRREMLTIQWEIIVK